MVQQIFFCTDHLSRKVDIREITCQYQSNLKWKKNLQKRRNGFKIFSFKIFRIFENFTTRLKMKKKNNVEIKQQQYS